MATVNLGSIKFNWKGAYSGATAYVVDDVVESGGSTYVCILASTGNTPPNATYWELMSQAGTNGTDGTDLGTTLTTQGDIVYRDASGLARLGAGTSGQVLQTNGTGANPSWGTVSSDMVKVTSGSFGSANTLIIDNLDFTTYDTFDIRLHNFRPTTGGIGHWVQIRYRYDNSGTQATDSSAQYRHVSSGHYTGASTASTFEASGTSAISEGRINWILTNSSNPQETTDIRIKTNNWNNTSFFKNLTFDTVGTYDNGNKYFYHLNGTVISQQNSLAFNGVEFKINTLDNFQTDYVVYGLK